MHRECVSKNVYWLQAEVLAQVTAGVIAGRRSGRRPAITPATPLRMGYNPSP